MNVSKAIKKRRSIRSFKNEPISQETILDILNCGRLAPSAKNRQPWQFVVLKSNIKNEVSDILYNKTQKEILESSASIVGTANAIFEANVLILIFKEKDENWIISDTLSIGACVENMCLRATELGLGALWIRDVVFASNEITMLVGKENMELSCALAIGIPNEKPAPRTRKDLKDMLG